MIRNLGSGFLYLNLVLIIIYSRIFEKKKEAEKNYGALSLETLILR